MRYMDNKCLGAFLFALSCAACDSTTEQTTDQSGASVDTLADESVVVVQNEPAVARIEVTGAASTGTTTQMSSEQTVSVADEPSIDVHNSDDAVHSDEVVTETTTDTSTEQPVIVENVSNGSSGTNSGSSGANSSSSSTNSGSSVTNGGSSGANGETQSVSNTSSDSETTHGGSGASAGVSSGSSVHLSTASVAESPAPVEDKDNYFCSVVGDVIDLDIAGIPTNPASQLGPVNLNAYSSLDIANHRNLQVVSHSDESIAVTVSSPDIVNLHVRFEDKYDQIYLSAVSIEASIPAILKKTYPNGRCSFALYTHSGCAVVASVSVPVTANVHGTSITADGCSLVNPHGISVTNLD